MFRRVDIVVSTGQYRDGAGGCGGAMGARIDATREPRRDHEAGFAEVTRQPFREFNASG